MKSKLTLAALCMMATIAANAQTSVKYIDAKNMNPSVNPGDNFYEYANGSWVKNNPIPSTQTSWGSFIILREESSKRLQTLLDNAAKTTTNRDRKSQMIGDFYFTAMDSVTIEKNGYKPIKVDLDNINSITNIQGIIAAIGTMRTQALGSALYVMNVGPDRKNVAVYIPQIGQGGTTLPDRDYYLKDDTRSTKIRDAYKVYLKTMFGLVGEDEATASTSSAAVLKIETELARAQYSRVEMRDPYKTYNKFTLADATALSPTINWATQFALMKVNVKDSILVGNPSFIKRVDVLLNEYPLSDWKSYLRWNILRSAAPYLSADFVAADFKFSQAQTGQKAPTPRYQRMSGLVDRTLGDLVGQLYVDKYFKPAAKVRMLELVKNLQVTFGERINKLDWMSNETKPKALEKLNAFANKIAYPDKWKTYDGVTISRTDFIANIRSANVWAYNNMVQRMGKPVDRTEMGMTPPTINASYNPSNNDLTFPAGILQFPFFDFGADDAVNYGGIGAVIGHEMTHGFDDQGRQYDAIGNLKDWWAKTDGDKFKSKANEVVEQYNAFTVLDTVHVNGKLTLGENLADLGGLSIAYEAFTKTKQFKENKKIDGLTPSQRFFLGWAQIWRNNTLPDNAAQLIVTDPHSPGTARVNGPLVNIDAWYTAFDIKPTDKLYKNPAARTKIW